MVAINPNDDSQLVYQVVDLNNNVRHILESSFCNVLVEGEASNVVTPYSGHVYFTLKDENAQVRCVCFRGVAQKLDGIIEDGAQLLVRAKLSVYVPRGDYQLIVSDVQLAGEGALQRAFLALKNKLEKQGMFAQKYKQAIPALPQRVGVITSATGAALRDVLRVLRRRFPAIEVIIYPSMVQGVDAPRQLISALDIANERAECDVLLLVRGGGSIEDLWAFNDEDLAEAIFHSRIPIVAGVGHQIDFTIADFVADYRAATPSAAAEYVSPDQNEIYAALHNAWQRLQQRMLLQLQAYELKLEQLANKLVHPGERIQQLQHRAQQLYLRLQHVMQRKLELEQKKMFVVQARLQSLDLQSRIQFAAQKLEQVQQTMHIVAQQRLTKAQHDFAAALKSLELLNPLAILQRGYTIVEKGDAVITSAAQVQAGDKLKMRMQYDQVDVQVL